MTEPVDPGSPAFRAFLQVAGAAVAQHQLATVLALDCQRVICIARSVGPELIALQHSAEGAGLQFHVATTTRALAALITAQDEVIVLSEGLLADPATAARLLEGRTPLVVVQPVETGLPDGFERIDINRASAGMLRVPGHLVEHLQVLPPDADVASALTRVALQSGIATREVPAAARMGAGWRMIRNEAEAQRAEAEWLKSCFAMEGRGVGGGAIARMGVQAVGASLLHAGNASVGLVVGAMGALALAFALGWFAIFWAAFMAVALAAVLMEAARLLRVAERRAVGHLPPTIARTEVLAVLLDLTLVGLLLWAQPRLPGQAVVAWLYPPAILILLLKLLHRIFRGAMARWISDRALLCLVLAALASARQISPGVEIMGLALAVGGLLLAVKGQD